MALIKNTDKVKRYRYSLDEFKIVNGSKVITLEPMNIGDISITHDYENNMFPLFKVNLLLDGYTMDYIIKNKNDIKFKVNIRKFLYSDDGKRCSMFTNVINDVFSIFLDTGESGFDKEEYTRRRKLDKEKGTVSNSLNELTNMLELYLFKDSYVNNSSTQINAILSSADVTTAITYILNKANIKNVLMSPAENKTVYKEFIIPAYSVSKNLSYIDQYYGLYSKGSIIYFGFDKLYILNCKSGCTAYQKDEYKETVFLIPKKNGSDNKQSYSLEKKGENKYYIHLNADTVSVHNTTIASNIIKGVNATVIDAENSSVVTTESNSIIKGTLTFTNNILNDTLNKYVGTIYSSRQYESSKSISISTTNCDINAFEPNKDVSFIFEDSTKNSIYKGHYRIANCTIHFVKDGSNYTMTTTATYKKTK